MNAHAAKLLEAFETLPASDKQTFANEILRRTRPVPFNSGSITDEEIGETGRSLSVVLDREEKPPRRGEVWRRYLVQ